LLQLICSAYNVCNTLLLLLLVLLLVLLLLPPFLQAPILTRRVHWQPTTRPLAAQRLSARVKAWAHVAALAQWTASAPLASVPAER
jgi:hypothetical protein